MPEPYSRLRWLRARLNNLRVGKRYKVKFRSTNPAMPETVRKLVFQGYQLPVGPGDALGYLFLQVDQGVRRLITMYRRIPSVLRQILQASQVEGLLLKSVRFRYNYRLGARGRDL